VVIVSYRCEPLLRDCLDSVRKHSPEGATKVQVIDNGSRDGTAEMVAREFPEVALTVNETNAGFSAANNIGVRAGTAPYVLILNPDTRVTGGALERMLELIESHPEVGICGPTLELEDGSLDHAAKRSFPTPISALGHFSGIGRRPEAGGELAAYRAPEVERGPVDAVNGACMLIRRTALTEVGLFDEGFWMYMEDLDLCYRLHEAGWVTWYEPSATVIHIKAGTTGRPRSARLDRAFHYGMYRFYRKHYAAEHNPLYNSLIYAGIALKLAFSLIASPIRRFRSRGGPDPRRPAS
jgi:N-acetylglucosaminyl-diphospho-decaprenol L-rhamnosyltransferase